MEKYIDADLLRKDIEFAKSVYDNPKRVVCGVADAFRQDGRAAMCDDILKKIDSLQQEQQEEPDKSLEEAAEEYTQKMLESWRFDSTGCRPPRESFIAGAEWQKEQDQPITGNSLEQEWLRYVDKKKKECRGELPSLGEYGWLQIARHFAEWQKSQMPMPEDTVLFNKGVAEGRRLMMEEAVDYKIVNNLAAYPVIYYEVKHLGLKYGDKVKLIIVKDDDN